MKRNDPTNIALYKRICKKISNDIGNLCFNQPHNIEPLNKQIENILNKTIKDDDCVSGLKVTLPNGEEPDENGNLTIIEELKL